VDCECATGPIIGHASIGDSRKRQLMLSSYTCADGQRYGISWPGWVMSGTVIASGQVQGLHDQDFIHNGKKLINPLDSPVRVLQLGGDICCLEHLGMVYNKFSYDEHGQRLEDIQRTDKQNWASAQRICQQKVRNCLRQLRISSGHHGERTLGSETYLGICANYVDIFISAKLLLYRRVVLATKVSFFFRLWRLWLKHGNHTVGGNTKSLTQAASFVSQQCFLDVQMSCHFVVLLIKMFRDFYLALEVSLHLTGSDSCEIFFSRIGGMQEWREHIIFTN
jgi:hypothetical protein